jgi:aromatic-L-amino-acid/L-tryptophan decarboxylase
VNAQRPEPVSDLDWGPERARELGEAVVELWAELLERLPELPVNRELEPAEIQAALALEVPDEGLSPERLMEHLRSLVFDHSMYPGHPGFFAYITGPGTVPGAAAALVAAALNQNSGGFRLSQGATELELHLTSWLAERFGLPHGSGGQVVSGGSMANFTALKAARDRALGIQARERGVAGGPPLALYASEEAHLVHARAADMLGVGAGAVRPVAVDSGFRMRSDVLADLIERDLAGGVRPMAVVATAGTTGTGAIDPLEEIAEVCARHGIWLHVDACYGGAAVLADDLRPLLAGTERADSIAIDPHKWLSVPLPAGCVLMREPQRLLDSFSAEAGYIWQDQAARRSVDIAHMGPDFSRGFTALKVWLSLLAHGRAGYGRRISHDAALARYLGELVEEHPDFELMTPVSLSICCFRYAPPALRGDEPALNRLNERLMTALQADGRVYPSNAVLGGRFALRACVQSFRTEAEHIELLLAVAEEYGQRLAR